MSKNIEKLIKLKKIKKLKKPNHEKIIKFFLKKLTDLVL
jgi:hypothetical protein